MGNIIKLGEMRNERTLFSKTWINNDGSYTTDINLTPMHYEDENGDLRTIDPGIEESPDLSFDGVRIPYSVKLPKVFSNGYTVSDNGTSLSMIPVNAMDSKGVIDYMDKSAVYYKEAWEDTDVFLEIKGSCVKETIIVKSEDAPSTFTFKVDGDLKADLSVGTLSLAPAWLLDANGVHRTVEQLYRKEKDGTVYIDLKADLAGLTFPITIDPTINVGVDGGVTDNQLDYETPNTPKLNPKQGILGRNDRYRIASKYAVLQTDFLKGVKVNKAYMNMLQVAVVGQPQMSASKLHAIIADYDPTRASWNNHPVYSETLVSQVHNWNTGERKWQNYEITGTLQAVADGTKVYGFLLKNVGTAYYAASEFALKDYYPYQYRPFMTVTYNKPPTTPTLVAPNGGENWNALEELKWTPSSDYLNSDVTIPAEDNKNIDAVTFGQIFTVERADWALTQVSMWMMSTDGAYPTGKLELVSVGGDYNFGNIVYATKEINLPNTLTKMSLDIPNLSFPAGTMLGIRYTDKLNFSRKVSLLVDEANSYRGGHYVQGTGVYYEHDIRSEVKYREGVSATKLKYQVQLSSDNGGTWKDIIPLTAEGVTTTAYDFSAEQNSATSRVRVRAYDGEVYGDWDMSDGVFTIYHNTAPLIPTNLAPDGGVYDRATPILMSWQHNDANGNDAQSRFELQWRVQGTSTWNTITQTTATESYLAGANTFPRGKIEWRVRTFDTSGSGGSYSNTVVFTAENSTASPNILTPTNGEIITVSKPTVTWFHSSQEWYWLKVKSSNGAVVYEDKKESSNKAATILIDLVDNSKYSIELAIKDSYGVWSGFVKVDIDTMYNPSVKPTVIAEVVEEHGWVTLDINSAPATGSTPKTSHYDIYRGTANGPMQRIAKDLKVNEAGMQEATQVIYYDRTPAPNTEVWYKIRSYSMTGSYSDSEIAIAYVTMKFVQLALTTDPSKYVTLKKRDAGKEVSGRKSATTEFVGRPYPMTEFGENLSREYSYSFKVYSWDDVLLMREFTHAGEALLLRDNWGKKDFVTIDKIDVTEARTYWTVSINPIKIHYVEGML